MASSDLIGLAFKYFNESVNLRHDEGAKQVLQKRDVTKIWNEQWQNERDEVHNCLGIFETQKNYLLNLLEHLRTRSTFLQESSHIHQESYGVYLAHQQHHTDNRLSDLLQEILGEYSKLLLKARDIQDQISRDYYHKVLVCTWKYQFAMSALCLFRSILQERHKTQQSSQSSFKATLINFEREKGQMKLLLDSCSELRKEFSGNYPIIGIKCWTSRSSPDITFMTANTCNELITILQKINELSQPEKTQDHHLEGSFLLVPNHLIPSPSVAVSPHLWNAQFRYYYSIHYKVEEETSLPFEQFTLCYHQQNTTKYFNHHIYYCLEESLKLREQEKRKISADNISFVLEEIYASSQDEEKLDLEVLEREPFIFDQFVSTHRVAASSSNISPALKQFVCLYPDVVRARSAFTNNVLHFAPITSTYYQQSCKNKESASTNAKKLSLFFFTYCPEIIPRKTASSTTSNNNLSSILINHFMPSQENVFSGDQEFSLVPPVPILLKVQDPFCTGLQPTMEKGILRTLCALGLDHPRCSGVTEKLNTQKKRLNHTYFYLQDKSSEHFYFIQAIPKKLALTIQEGGDVDLEQRYYIESILKEVSFEWLSTILPSFQNFPSHLKEPLANRMVRVQRCDWRSCLCNSIGSNYTTHHLCQFHQMLKEFVDSCMVQRGNQKNSTKFMPKIALKEISVGLQSEINVNKNPSQAGALAMKRDLKILRSSSSLLLEIWDGKLKNTIQTFIRKTVNELNLRAFIELINQSAAFSTNHFLPVLNGREASSNRQQYSHSSPPWIVWKDKERLQRTLQALQNNIEVLSSILTSERFVTRELRYFFDLGCFPNQEIIIIKKEMKQFKDYQQKLLQDSEISSIAMAGEVNDHEQGTKTPSNHLDPLQMIQSNHELLYQILIEENKLLDRKLHLFSQRRQVEAEVKQAYLKKMMKMKAMEEAESKDPNSFKNQFSR